MILIDTHCHLDAAEFDSKAEQFALEAYQSGVQQIVVPAVCTKNFAQVAELGKFGGYALGIHPLYIPQANEHDLQVLRRAVDAAMTNSDFVAIGEIGLDFFVQELCTPEMREKQLYFFREQLRIARDADLPVVLHVRRSVDLILKSLREISVSGGIAHAFNGSEQQANMLIKLGFKLGFGGAMTYTRALQIRRLAVNLPLMSIVLETDAPDIPPSWLDSGINSPKQLHQIAQVCADLRGIPLVDLARATTNNAYTALPRLRRLPDQTHVY